MEDNDNDEGRGGEAYLCRLLLADRLGRRQGVLLLRLGLLQAVAVEGGDGRNVGLVRHDCCSVRERDERFSNSFLEATAQE